MFTAVFSSNVKDVREILNDYKQYDDPIKAFRENQRILKVNIDLFYKYDKLTELYNSNCLLIINIHNKNILKYYIVIQKEIKEKEKEEEIQVVEDKNKSWFSWIPWIY